jgi:hypothetical protein
MPEATLHKKTVGVSGAAATILAVASCFGYQSVFPAHTPKSLEGAGDRIRAITDVLTKLQADMAARNEYQDREWRALLERVLRQDIRMENEEKIAGTLATLVAKIEDNTGNMRSQMTIQQSDIKAIMEKLGVIRGRQGGE